MAVHRPRSALTNPSQRRTSPHLCCGLQRAGFDTSVRIPTMNMSLGHPSAVEERKNLGLSATEPTLPQPHWFTTRHDDLPLRNDIHNLHPQFIFLHLPPRSSAPLNVAAGPQIHQFPARVRKRAQQRCQWRLRPQGMYLKSLMSTPEECFNLKCCLMVSEVHSNTIAILWASGDSEIRYLAVLLIDCHQLQGVPYSDWFESKKRKGKETCIVHPKWDRTEFQRDSVVTQYGWG
ncbi:hypothetical protein B0H11DRAFT_1918377 [Mycena galericulata]|nr:hypothetical protein B0H11DRAFT_1918377 [Mycena galericulata]